MNLKIKALYKSAKQFQNNSKNIAETTVSHVTRKHKSKPIYDLNTSKGKTDTK